MRLHLLVPLPVRPFPIPLLLHLFLFFCLSVLWVVVNLRLIAELLVVIRAVQDLSAVLGQEADLPFG